MKRQWTKKTVSVMLLYFWNFQQMSMSKQTTTNILLYTKDKLGKTYSLRYQIIFSRYHKFNVFGVMLKICIQNSLKANCFFFRKYENIKLPNVLTEHRITSIANNHLIWQFM